MERHFFSNLVAREVEQERKAPINQRFANHLLERDLHLADFEVKQNSPSMGKSLKGIKLQAKVQRKYRNDYPGREANQYTGRRRAAPTRSINW